MIEDTKSGPLAGVVVADLSRVLAGPYCTMMLADLGATVIKVESRQGDETRTWVPPERDGEGTYYLAVNRGKHSIALDFADPDDRALLGRIVERADVVVENFKPGGLARFGLDYETLSAQNPALVYASITGFGSRGGADLPGYDLLAQAVSGMMTITGSADGGPTKVGVAIFDVIAGLHAVTGILAALRTRDATGRGDRIEVNLLSSALSGLVNQASAYVAGGVEPQRMGNAHPSLYPYEPFPARDRDIVIAVGNDAQFARLAAVVGLPADERFATMRGRNLARGDLRAALIERLAARDADEWFALLRDAGVPAAPILGVGGGVELAAELGLEPVVLAGDVPTIRNPIGFAHARADAPSAPPALDGDRDAVREWLDRG